MFSDFCLKQRKEQILNLRKDISIVFAGDSNVELSVNDSLVKNSINIAQSGEAYLYTYAKIRSLLDYNKGINTVLVGFSYHELLKDKEDLVLFQDSYIIEKIKIYNYLLKKREKNLIFRRKPIAYIEGLFQGVFNNFRVFAKSYSLNGQKRKILNFGGYIFSVRDKLIEDIRIQDSIKSDTVSSQLIERGLFQEEYLRLISQLCHQKSVRLILLNTPKHFYYSYKINEDVKYNWLSVRNSMPEDSLFDFSTLSLPDSCYSDITHLNYKGARIFSNYLDACLHPTDTTALRKLQQRFTKVHK